MDLDENNVVMHYLEPNNGNFFCDNRASTARIFLFKKCEKGQCSCLVAICLSSPAGEVWGRTSTREKSRL